MEKRIVVWGLLVAIMSVTALGAGFLGTPTAELKKGQWSVGYNYLYGNLDFDDAKVTESWYEDGELIWGPEKVKLEIDDVTVQRHYATFSLGVEEWWEVMFQLGSADVRADIREEGAADWTSLNFDNDFAWGWGTRITFLEQEKISWGASFQMNWMDTSSDDKGSWNNGPEDSGTWTDSYDIETYDLIIAIGPTIDMGGWKLYGGPFYYYLSGDIDEKYSDTDGLYVRAKGDLSSGSIFGGFIGAQFPLGKHANLTTEFSYAEDAWAIGAGISWRF